MEGNYLLVEANSLDHLMSLIKAADELQMEWVASSASLYLYIAYDFDSFEGALADIWEDWETGKELNNIKEAVNFSGSVFSAASLLGDSTVTLPHE